MIYELQVHQIQLEMQNEELRQTQQALETARDQFSDLYDFAPVGYLSVGRNGLILGANLVGAALLGVERRLLIGLPLSRFVAAENQDTYHKYRRSLLVEQSRRTCEIKLVKRDGTEFGAQLESVGVEDSDGTVSAYRTVISDITQRKQAEQENTRLRLQLQSMIDSMPSILVGLDREGRVTAWNRHAQEATGLSPNQAEGRPFDEIFSQLDAQLGHVALAIRRREPMTARRVTHQVDGDTRYSDVMVYPLLAGAAQGAVIRVDDVTPQVRIEQMIVQTEKMVSVGGLAAGMAHEINNPLSIISQASQNIARRVSATLAKNQEVARALGTDLEAVLKYLHARGIVRFLGDIQEAVARAAKIVGDMLAFSRRSQATQAPADLGKLLDTATRLAANDYDLNSCYDFKHISIEREYEPKLGAVICDPRAERPENDTYAGRLKNRFCVRSYRVGRKTATHPLRSPPPNPIGDHNHEKAITMFVVDAVCHSKPDCCSQ